MNEITEQAEEIFCSALEIEDADGRTSYVDQACSGNDDLRAAVTYMLETQSEAERFFMDGTPTRISATEISRTLSELPEFFENMEKVLPDDDEVGKQIGNYKLLQKIGEGGGGNVYLAEQSKPVRRQVALKIIKLGMDTKSVIARFEAERQALAMMEHPNIAHVLNAGATETGRPFFVMELVHGVKITRYCDENRLNVVRRLELFIQVCHAIQHAHQKGIIHRDIKPSNVLITLHDGVPMPKVIDFGIAKATKGDLLADQTLFTSAEPFIGTPAYMSPEQADFAHMDIDMRSDVYSLGALLYELLCGSPPFDQKQLLKSGVEEMRRTLREVGPVLPSRKLLSLSEDERNHAAGQRDVECRRLISVLGSELDWVVMKALEKDRERRYQTVDGFTADIQRYLNHEPVIARPPSRRYRFRKLVLRNKGVFASVTAISLTMMAGLGTSSWLFVKERAALHEMERARQSEAALRREAEARERISQAAVLLKRGGNAQADQLLKDVQIPVIKPSLEAIDVFGQLADWNLIEGNWEPAADNLMKLAQAYRVDKNDMSDSATRVLLRVAPILVATGDTDSYRALIEEAIAHFADTPDPVAAEQVIKVSIIQPMDAETRNALSPMAHILRETMNADEPVKDYSALDGTCGDWDPMMKISDREGWAVYMRAWQAFALAWYEYRAGNYAEARLWAVRCLSYKDTTLTRIAMGHVLLAMSTYRQGLYEDARFELALARALVERRFPDGLGRVQDLGDQNHGYLHDWVMAYVLLQEAQALIANSPDQDS